MKEAVLEWKDATNFLPEVKDYNKDGGGIVAYENGVVSRGYVMTDGEWAFQDRHGKALFWAPYPEHPLKEDIRNLSI